MGILAEESRKLRKQPNSLTDTYSDEMKIKIKITGPKVHDVGYRYFLMTNAIDMGLRGFHARNRTSGRIRKS